MTISYIGIQLKIQNNKIEMLIHVSYNHNSQSNNEKICSEVSFALSIIFGLNCFIQMLEKDLLCILVGFML